MARRSVLLLGLLSLFSYPVQAAWLDDVGLLITARERETFQTLSSEADRQAFIQRFWQVRDPYPETPRNEAKERWEERLQEARRRWSNLQDDRARVYLLNGEPAESFEVSCSGVPLEIWDYPARFQVKFRTVLIFLRDGSAPVRLWHPGDAPVLTSTFLPEDCRADSRMANTALWLRVAGREGYAIVAERALAPPRPREWVSSFRPASTAPAKVANALPARLDVDFPGRLGDGLVRVLVAPQNPIERRTPPSAGGSLEMVLSGRIKRDEETVDSFRYRFSSLPSAAGSGGFPVAFERRLRPGHYKLEVEIEDPAAGSFVAERELAIPEPEAPATPAPAQTVTVASNRTPAETTPEVRRLFEEADASLKAPRPGVHAVIPDGKLLAGVQRVEARIDRAAGLADSEQIQRVSFALDGQPVFTRNRPPYVAQLDLGRTPRPHLLAVEGMNARGEVLARDEVTLNAGGQRLAVHFLEPRPGEVYRNSLRAQVKVDLPEDQALDRVELYLGDSRVATLYQPPFTQPLRLPDAASIGYVRAVAFLADGASAEDLVLLNAPATADKIDVRLVELYTNVVDGTGRPVESLGSGEFRVFEDGVKQTLRTVERVEDTPLRLVTLIDNSGSMRPRLEPTRQAALQFLRHTLRPVDQAALITFNRAPKVAVGLTNDLAALEDGLSGLMADEETSLYDSLIFSLYYLGGARGQRAVLLLSDGDDHTSGFHFEDALESARRAGIAVYTIGLGLPKGPAADRLTRLAAETGGRSFLLPDTNGLDQAYQEIARDLRSRYHLAYESTNTHTGDAFRAVRVEVGKPGLEARTISGYYP
ncbi:MAG: VWA domain-containing protein [Thermoanaerobaculia bacterium]